MMTKRGRMPSLITGSNGKPGVVTVQRQRKCTRCEEKIPKGSQCFEIPRVGGGFSNKKPFCNNCFTDILHQTDLDLKVLENHLKSLKEESGG